MYIHRHFNQINEYNLENDVFKQRNIINYYVG